MGIEDLYNYNRNRESESEYEYYEDTHDESGEYTQKLRSFITGREREGREDSFTPGPDSIVERAERKQEAVCSISNVMVYEPKREKESQEIIDFVKKSEPIILNLEETPAEFSQRILDFVAGAIYALNGSIHRVSGDVFLIVPGGVKVTMQEKEGKK